MNELVTNQPRRAEGSQRGVVGASMLWMSLALATGLAIGLGVFTFVYAQGASYMTNDPAACANCHVMNEQYAGWMKGSHASVAVCNDCHTPAGFVPKYWTKAQNGFFHSLAFTTGWFPDNIQIHGRNLEITREACSKCHAEITERIQATRVDSKRVDCITCHDQVGHAK
ncbi:MAG: cytochrome c nitrite reductase small subunit [Candidatus Hydrogenedentes bacterium]|nr:cytochrome c nitrite reductase small subunit [Candidatus Hydrogenedentota bacterium]